MENLQEKVRRFCKENDLQSPLEHRLLDTVSELGEAAKEVLKMSNYGRKEIEYKEELETELGDVLFSMITVANKFDINLKEALDKALEKYEERLEEGSAGSGKMEKK